MIPSRQIVLRGCRGLSTVAKEPLVVTSTTNGVTTLRMNNPKKLNGWTEPMLLTLFDAFQAAENDPETKVVVLTGTGKYYCAGVDLSGTIKPMHPAELHNMIKTSNQKVFDTFLKFPKPIIAAVNGPAIGASVTTTTLCDHTIAGESATFLTPFARLGVPPEGCSSVHFEFLMGKEGDRMLGKEAFTPTGAEAAKIGLIKEVVPDDELLSRAQDLGESWVADSDKMSQGRSHMGYTDTDKLVKVNEKESEDLADAFLSAKFLSAQAAFLGSKGKTIPSLVFKVLVATRPLWSNLYTSYSSKR